MRIRVLETRPRPRVIHSPQRVGLRALKWKDLAGTRHPRPLGGPSGAGRALAGTGHMRRYPSDSEAEWLSEVFQGQDPKGATMARTGMKSGIQ